MGRRGATARPREVERSSGDAAVSRYFEVVTKVIGWIIKVLYYVDISCNGARDVPVFLLFF